MLLAVVLDEIKDKDLINYINSFKKENQLIDYNTILIDLLKKGLESSLETIKQDINNDVLLKIDDSIKEFIKNELSTFKQGDNLAGVLSTLDLILDKLNNVNFVANIKGEEVQQQKKSEYEEHINKNKKEINIDVDINPLLANILNNANR